MKIIAHRGASGDYPENTLLAFEQALEQGADGIELDLQFHPQGEMILLHDLYLDVKTSGQGKVTATPSEEILKLTVGDSSQRVCTLMQALKLIAGRCLINIEIKSGECDNQILNGQIQQLLASLAEAVEHYQFKWQQFIISSFNHRLLQQLNCHPNRHADLKTATLIHHIPADHAALAVNLSAHSINPSYDCLTEELVADAKAHGIEIWVYTVDRQAEVKRCLALGVDAIFTNYPAISRIHTRSDSDRALSK